MSTDYDSGVMRDDIKATAPRFVYTGEECELLRNLVMWHMSVIENRNTDRLSKRAKDSALEKLTDEYNSQPGIRRVTVSQLRKLRNNEKSKWKKKQSEETRVSYATGGGPSTCRPMSPSLALVGAAASHMGTRLLKPYDSDGAHINQPMLPLPPARILESMVTACEDNMKDLYLVTQELAITVGPRLNAARVVAVRDPVSYTVDLENRRAPSPIPEPTQKRLDEVRSIPGDLPGFNGPPAHIEQKDNARPTFLKSRPFPLALKDDVAKELESGTTRVFPLENYTGSVKEKILDLTCLCSDYRSTCSTRARALSWLGPSLPFLESAFGARSFAASDKNSPKAWRKDQSLAPDLSRKAVLEAETDKHMNLVENRLASFERWPFIGGDCLCTPENMSKAGFYHCPTDEEPDLARCYVCFMELSCWEQGDNPFNEHLRSTHCAFVRMDKKAGDLTVREFLDLEKARAKNRAHKFAELHMATLHDTMRKVNHEMDKVRRKQ
ncbi:hypothetical protein MTO96_020006 [Rhipicephalus appendiculatus]